MRGLKRSFTAVRFFKTIVYKFIQSFNTATELNTEVEL